MRNRLLLILLTLLLALGFGAGMPAAALADGNGGDNAAVAINTRDGSSLFRFAFKVRHVAGDVVDNVNAAVAFSSCESCRTTAIAIQIVLVEGSPSTVTPQNLALAVNDQCTLCQTFASAYQFVLSTHGPVKFTPEGWREIVAIKRDIRDLRHEDLSAPELDARVSEIVGRLRVVLDTQLVPRGAAQEGDGESDENVEEQTDLDQQEQPTTTSSEETETTVTTQADTSTGQTDTAPADTATTDTTQTTTTP